MIKGLYNLIINIFKYKNFKEIYNKIINKFEKDTKDISINWANSKIESIDEFCKNKNYKIWQKTKSDVQSIINKISLRNNRKYNLIETSGSLTLIYFLILLKKPNNIIETGVAYGFSTEIILNAINKNKCGHLFSSDLPYYKIKNSTRNIGIAVSKKLKKNWTLNIKGDEIAISKFLEKINKIDFFHYDSDKSYSGRKKITQLILKKLNNKSTFVMDDIQDNTFFRDFVIKYKFEYHIFKYQNKLVGLIENIGKQLNN